LGAALDVRGVRSANNLVADVEGDIEDVDGVLKITKIRLHYHVAAPTDKRETVERAIESHAEKCPAYLSVKGCIDCSWRADITEE
jgi:uncharacterized OsmC-like protein